MNRKIQTVDSSFATTLESPYEYLFETSFFYRSSGQFDRLRRQLDRRNTGASACRGDARPRTCGEPGPSTRRSDPSAGTCGHHACASRRNASTSPGSSGPRAIAHRHPHRKHRFHTNRSQQLGGRS